MPPKSADAKPYRFCQKSVALTCSGWRSTKLPQAEFSAWVLSNFVDFQPWGIVDDWCFSQEEHKDGTIHWHGYLSFANKYQHKDAARIFDRDAPDTMNTHPTIRSCRSPKGWIAYVQKDGDYCGTLSKVDTKDPSAGYLRKKADAEAYAADKTYQELKGKPEADLKAGPLGLDLTEGGKKRHYWVVGPPDAGKTTQVQRFFAGTNSAYMRPPTKKYPYEGYMDEQFIVVDDYFPSLAELLNVTNTYLLRTERWGESRYVRRYWKLGQERTFIILTNVRPVYWNEPSFIARFHVVSLYQHATEGFPPVRFDPRE